MRLGLYPNLGVAWYWACLVGEGRPLVTVIDHEVALPKAPSLEIRAEGLWADHIVETPFDHMTLGCEAFAVAVDDPAEVYGDLRGDRVPFGFDLEWETDREGLYPWIGATRYEVSCNVHGEVLVGDETIELDGIGQRDHSWGVRDWWTLGWVWTAGGLEDGTRFHTARIRRTGMEGFAPGYVMPPGAGVQQIGVCTAEETLGDHGFPVQRRDHLRSSRADGGAALLQPRPPRRRGSRRHPPRPLPARAVPLRERRRTIWGRVDGVEPTGSRDLTGAGGRSVPSTGARPAARLPRSRTPHRCVRAPGDLGDRLRRVGAARRVLPAGRCAPVHGGVPRLQPLGVPREPPPPLCRW